MKESTKKVFKHEKINPNALSMMPNPLKTNTLPSNTPKAKKNTQIDANTSKKPTRFIMVSFFRSYKCCENKCPTATE